MPNKNYLKGRKKEYKVLKECRAKGHIALRSAGSHSPIDIVDINLVERIIRFVQCKPDSMSENAKNKILEENSLLKGPFYVFFEVV